ncbi:hypothetical protein NtRootC7_41300 (plasmid) [Arthrobacter sp. NtRootC7]|nr:hypothetical protein NtRootC7_41300 [Arthrobacter sp. NtRootC7]
MSITPAKVSFTSTSTRRMLRAAIKASSGALSAQQVRPRPAKISIQRIDSTNEVFGDAEHRRNRHQVLDLPAFTGLQAHQGRPGHIGPFGDKFLRQAKNDPAAPEILPQSSHGLTTLPHLAIFRH